MISPREHFIWSRCLDEALAAELDGERRSRDTWFLHSTSIARYLHSLAPPFLALRSAARQSRHDNGSRPDSPMRGRRTGSPSDLRASTCVRPFLICAGEGLYAHVRVRGTKSRYKSVAIWVRNADATPPLQADYMGRDRRT